MGKKRKRPTRGDSTRPSPSKQPTKTSSVTPSKSNGCCPASDAAEISHPVISQYYRRVVTLRQYVLQHIPPSLKARRRRIAALRSEGTPYETNGESLAHLLDTTLVGIWTELPLAHNEERRRDFITYTQTQLRTQIGTDIGPASPQSELVDFVISSLFTRRGDLYRRAQHVLTHGFQEAQGFPHSNLQPCSLMGVEARFPNKNVEKLKQSPWTDLLALLGRNGEEIMLRLLLDCGIFVAMDVKKDIYYQISGRALSALEPVRTLPAGAKAIAPPTTKDPQRCLARTNSDTSAKEAEGKNSNHNPSTIFFSIRQTCYARPRLDTKGRIELGMPDREFGREAMVIY
ncbi:hypothetical protein BJX63DRAFT_349126 [Aspergillus granulosus]|uniref:Telomerase reverse transcriptase n=1 Tax=Aspergillus granulosus TaxID=176169 RepID=A0ABR4H2U3_9EURO